MNDDALGPATDIAGEAQQAFRRGRIHGLRRLSLHQNEPSRSSWHDEIDFKASQVTEAVQFAATARIDLLLADFRRHEAFKNCAQESRAGELALGLDTKEMTSEAGVHEVQLRRLHQALAKVLEKRRHEHDLARGLQNTQPLADTGHGHAQ